MLLVSAGGWTPSNLAGNLEVITDSQSSPIIFLHLLVEYQFDWIWACGNIACKFLLLEGNAQILCWVCCMLMLYLPTWVPVCFITTPKDKLRKFHLGHTLRHSFLHSVCMSSVWSSKFGYACWFYMRFLLECLLCEGYSILMLKEEYSESRGRPSTPRPYLFFAIANRPIASISFHLQQHRDKPTSTPFTSY